MKDTQWSITGMETVWNRFKPYVISAAIPLLVGGLAAFLTKENMDLYDRIRTPPLSPPGFLFPIVWTVLYVLMGVGAALVYEKRGEKPQEAKKALQLYALQLLANFGWSLIFFNHQAYLLAFVWLLVLWVLILAMIRAFAEVDERAAYLQIPYLLWVTFAGYLNLAIYLLNGG